MQRESDIFKSEITECVKNKKDLEIRITELEAAIKILVDDKTRIFDEKRNLETLVSQLKRDLDKQIESNLTLHDTINVRDRAIETLTGQKEASLAENDKLKKKVD
jgi:predicted RNase H-like nuclease (RuvC/YqgF family)